MRASQQPDAKCLLAQRNIPAVPHSDKEMFHWTTAFHVLELPWYHTSVLLQLRGVLFSFNCYPSRVSS